MALITVIVPIYQVERYLEKCLSSIFEQTLADFVVLMVNDGSTDGSRDIAQRFAERDSRFHLLDKANGGLSDARNYALDLVETPFICFVDSDDYVPPRYLEVLYNGVVAHASDIAVCDVALVDESGAVLGERKSRHRRPMTGEDACRDNLGCRLLSMAQNKIFTARIFQGVRFPYGLAYEDRATTYKLFLAATTVSFVDEVRYFYLQRGGSIMNSFDCKKFDDRLKVHFGINEYFYERGDFSAFRKYIGVSRYLNIYVSGLIQYLKFSTQRSAQFEGAYSREIKAEKFSCDSIIYMARYHLAKLFVLLFFRLFFRQLFALKRG